MDKKSWYDGIDLSTSNKSSLEQIALFALFDSALNNDTCIFKYSKSGNITVSFDAIFDFFKVKLGGRLICENIDRALGRYDDQSETMFVWDDGLVYITIDNVDWFYISVASLNKSLVHKIKEFCEDNIKIEKQGRAYMFALSPDGSASLTQISGQAGLELERDNYTKEVLADYDHIVKDLNSSTPCSRLVILSGLPGAGKSFLIRGIANAVNGTFVIVPPTLVSELMSPNFVSVLKNYYKKDDGPIIFVIEDADSVLVNRQSDNMNAISNLLNMGAGIFGSLYDLRIIATTNSRKLEVDKAITRNGRCCRYTEITALEPTHASRVFKRLTKNEKAELPSAKSYTLADIYHMANSETDLMPEEVPVIKLN